MRKVPATAIEFIAAHEGCRLTAYLDSANVPTIGYGHIDGVKMGDTCTAAQARAWLALEVVTKAAQPLAAKIGNAVDALTENQYAALLSLVFNVGAGDWTIFKLVKARQFDQVPTQFMRFVNAGGRKVQGLVNRRADEVKLWSTDEPGSEDITLTSATTRAGDTPPTLLISKRLPLSKRMWLGITTALAAAGNWVTENLPNVGNWAHQLQQLIAPQMAYSDFLAKLSGGLAMVIVGSGAAVAFLQVRAHQDGKK